METPATNKRGTTQKGAKPMKTSSKGKEKTVSTEEKTLKQMH